jgi:UDP-N-acetylmuramate: L-alanyl-gamma-D-glutamyl-meso-diaminopimelate ligase
MPDRPPRVHFIGVCGTAMATLAALLKARGLDVQGSDHHMYPPMSEFLATEGIRTFDAFRAAQITDDLDVVVVGNAISRGNEELEAVLDRRVRYVSLPEAIRDHFLWQARSVVIAGTHGKTTTTSMVAWLLTAGGRDPSALIGGIAANFGRSYRLGAGPEFVIEGDEYDSAYFDKTAKFLKYRPDLAVVGNVEYDHADIYPDMEALRTAFRRFVNLVPKSGLVVLGADSPEALRLSAGSLAPVETVGLGDGADWRAVDLQPAGGRTTFSVRHRGAPFGTFEMAVMGEHNVRNALAALAIGHAVGLSADAMRTGLATFEGVRRRLELRGRARGVSVYDDFAHHPTAIFETIRALRAAQPGHRVWALFEPRSATSCRRVFQADFARAFADSGADQILLAPVFRSSLPDVERLSIPQLVGELTAAGRPARAPGSTDEIVAVVAGEARDGDLVLVMSNGAFDGIHDRLLAALGSRPDGV